MQLDRELQKELLTKLSSVYPSSYDFNNDYSRQSIEYNKAIANLFYLQSHELVEQKSVFISNTIGTDTKAIFGAARISHKGMDFLADDGGLSAILGVITVKLDESTIKDLLAIKIHDSDLPEDKKESMIDAIKGLPAEGVRQLALKLMDMGLEKIPDAVSQIAKHLNIF